MAVYALGGPETTRIKLGYSNVSASMRLNSYQLLSPVLLEILWQRPGGPLAEEHLHLAFAARRHHGEWFEFADVDDPLAQIDGVYQEWVDRKLKRQELVRQGVAFERASWADWLGAGPRPSANPNAEDAAEELVP